MYGTVRRSQRKVVVKTVEKKDINYRLIAEYFAKKFNEERERGKNNV